MFKDSFGVTRQKVALHVHTSVSDGAKSPEEAVAIYRANGFDAVALTDHWNPGVTHETDDGFPILAGVEYNNPTGNGAQGVYHILGIGYDKIPSVERTDTPDKVAGAIHACGGIAILAHPAWSLNDPTVVAAMDFFDATEIYNTVSGVHASDRPYSGAFVDLLAAKGRAFPLTAADDTHYYDNDACVAYVAVASEDSCPQHLFDALRRGDYYATMGPEIHLRKTEDGVELFCSPASHISFRSNIVWTPEANLRGEGLTYAKYPLHPGEFFVRAEVTDKDGKQAWSHVLFF